MPNEILIRNVYPADPDLPPQTRPRTTDILVRDGRIAAVEDGIQAPDAEVIEGDRAIAVAGMVDSHRHVWQTAIRGVAADWSLADYVREIRVGYATAYTPEHIYLANLSGALEALDTGVTTLCDFSHLMNSPAHAEAAIQGLTDAGIRGVFCYGFYDVPARERAFASHDDRLRHAEEVAQSFRATAGPLLDFGVALTEFGLVGPDVTDRELAFARRHDALITLHVGTFGSPHGIADLDRRGRLGPDMLHVHANMCGDDELERLVASGGGLSITPETEMQMGMGWPVTNRLIEAGGLPSFGVDIASNIGGDMLTQMRLALQTARAIDNQKVLDQGIVPDRIGLTVRDALRFGTEGGARAMRMGGEIGTLRKGARADIALFATGGLNMMPMGDPVAMLLLESRPGDAVTVLVDGRVAKRDGRMVGVDLAGLREKLDRAFGEIADRVAESRDTAAGSSNAYARVVKRATGTD
ncbi:amidohydrolase family protein [Tistrella mobilis]|uniref:amidohydrolase family protein n=1 Tax=Tistrella mobilis TaxID=171437 RepID=UPI003557C33E